MLRDQTIRGHHRYHHPLEWKTGPVGDSVPQPPRVQCTHARSSPQEYGTHMHAAAPKSMAHICAQQPPREQHGYACSEYSTHMHATAPKSTACICAQQPPREQHGYACSSPQEYGTHMHAAAPKSTARICTQQPPRVRHAYACSSPALRNPECAWPTVKLRPNMPTPRPI